MLWGKQSLLKTPQLLHWNMKPAQTVNKGVWLCSNIAPSTKMGSGPILSTGCSLPSSALGHPILWNILIKLIFNSKTLLWCSLWCEYFPVRYLNSSCIYSASTHLVGLPFLLTTSPLATQTTLTLNSHSNINSLPLKFL